MVFSDVLDGLLKERNITQKELAKACNLSSQCVSALITKRNNPTGTTLIALSKYFGVSTDYLLGLEDDFGIKETQKNPQNCGRNGITDKQTADVVNMFKLLSDIQKAQVFGYILALLEQNGVNVKNILEDYK